MSEHDSRTLLLVAVNTDQPNIQRRLNTILAAAEPIEGVSNAEVWAFGVFDLDDLILDRLAALIGWDAVRRLKIGEG